jgi:uncharacterized damage-inducible protein DinB
MCFFKKRGDIQMKTIKKMFSHLSWANERILETLQNNDNESARRLFVHILCAEQVWLARLEEKDSSQLPIWADDISLSVCTALAKKNETDFISYLNNLASSDLDRVVTYKNSKGIPYKTSISDILSHVALHGQYHRGQINLQLRINGNEPINVDYITFVR